MSPVITQYYDKYPIVWSLGGFRFCVNGNLFRIIALQIQEASIPIPHSNMESGG